MRIRIGTKLTAGFMLVVLLMVTLSLYLTSISQKSLRQSVGRSSVFLAEEMLKRINESIYHKIEVLQSHSKEASVQEILLESNREFEKSHSIEEYVGQKDREWISAPKDQITPFMQDLISNKLSNSLRRHIVRFQEEKYGYSVFKEIFITNRYGANVAQTRKTSDYRQDDEEWWQIARERRFYVSDIEYDESSRAHGITIGIGIDDERGDFMGVLKAILSVKEIIKEAEIATKKYETTSVTLVTKDGLLLYRTSAFRLLEDLSSKGLFKMIQDERGFFTVKDGGVEKLFSYARSKGHREFGGLEWILMVGHDEEEVLKPAFVLRNTMILASLVLITISIIIAFLISRSITSPLAKLSKGVEIIGEGDLEHRVELETKDEVGELSVAFNEMAERRQKAEEALRESEQRYRLLAENVTDVIWTIDMDMRFTYISPSVEHLLGYTAEEAMAQTIEESMSPASFETVIKVFAEELEKHEKGQRDPEIPRVLELDLTHKAGSTITTEIKANFLYDSAGQPMGVIGVTRDITERKRSEEALRASEEKYRTILENIEEGYYEVDTAGNFTFFNDSMCKVLGYPKDEMIDMNNRQFMDQDTAKTVYQTFNKVYNTGKADKGTDWELTRKDGIKRTVETSVGLMKDEEGRAIGFRGVARDITDRKRAEEALLESEERYRDLYENAPNPYFSVSAVDGIISRCNNAATRLLGYDKESLMGMKAFDLYADTPNGLSLAQEAFKRFKAGEHVRDLELQMKHKGGDNIWISLSVEPVRDSDGNIVESRSMVINISERKRLESQLRQAQKMQAIGTLAGGIAHEFNNMLWLITGNVELALDEIPERNPARHQLERVTRASLRAKSLVNQILSFSRKRELERKPLEISPIVEESLKLLKASIPTTIEIRQDISTESGTILADPAQVDQVFMNLCTNAAYAMRDNGGILDVSLVNAVIDEDAAALHQDLTPGKYVRLTVRDTGHGMEPETKERIFDPFFTTKEVGEGTGMGLSAVHGIVKSYGGTITVESEPGKGSTFQVFFPSIEREAEPQTETSEGIPTGDERILFIDDEHAIVDTVKEILFYFGYEVVTMTSPIEALEAFRAESDKFDLVITDMTMPKMTGEKLAKEMLEICPDIPIILCTGHSDVISEEKSKELGIKEFIMKPIGKREMAMTIRSVLDQGKGD